jgi:hypothetical protein
VFVGECGVCGEMWGFVGKCGDLWGFVGKCGVCGETHALRILGSYGKTKNGKSHLADTRVSLSIRKVGICVKMSVCCRVGPAP